MKISKPQYDKLKKIIEIIILIVLAGFVIYVNVSEIRKGNSTKRTIAGSNFRDVEYFKDFNLKTFGDEGFSNQNLDGYDVIIVNIWEPYCTPCLEEMPELDELNREYKEKGLLVVSLQGMAYKNPEDVGLGIELVENMNISMPVLLADQRFSEEVLPYLNESFPGTFVLDKEGNILDFVAGAKSKAAWQEYFDSFL